MYYLLILVLLFLAELFYFKVADRCNIIDKPNERSSHTKVTLRGGGIIFYFGALAYFLTSGFEYPWFPACLDTGDVHQLRGRYKIHRTDDKAAFSFLCYGYDVLSVGAVLLVLVVDSHSLDSLYGHHQCLQFYGWD